MQEQIKREKIIGNQYPKKVIPLINKAKSNIYIIAYAWKWYKDDIGCSVMKFNYAIIDKACKGTEIKAITESKEIIPILKMNGVKIKEKKIEKIIHAKMILIDDEIVIIGSHNITKNAFEKNLEISLLIYDKMLNKEYKNFFETLWQS